MLSRLKLRRESWHADRVKPTAIQRWNGLAPSRRALLIESAAALFAASLAVKALPFKWAIRLSSRPIVFPHPNLSAEVVSNVRWAIDAAARRLPWNAVCIQRGLAAQWMLRRRGIDARLHYGLAKDGVSALRAHVWVDAAGETIIGDEEAVDYVRVATFP